MNRHVSKQPALQATDTPANEAPRNGADLVPFAGLSSTTDRRSLGRHPKPGNHSPALNGFIRNRIFQEAAQKLAEKGMMSDRRAGDEKLVEALKAAFYSERRNGSSALDEPLIRAFMQQASPIDIKLGTLEAVARGLGNDWETDRHSFLDVTIAMSRLQLAMRQVVISHRNHWSKGERGLAMITLPQGEQHSFAQCLIEEIFRANGWDTDLYTPASRTGMIDRLRSGRHDIVCLSWSTGTLAPAARHSLQTIEEMPLSDRPAVIAGGTASHDNHGWMVRLGVDHLCESTYGALSAAQQLLELRSASFDPPPDAEHMTPSPAGV